MRNNIIFANIKNLYIHIWVYVKIDFKIELACKGESMYYVN